MRLKPTLFLLATLSVAISCLEPVEPTPHSSEVVIDPAKPSVPGFELTGGSFFGPALSIRNTSQQPIYVDVERFFVEKLIDQKWQYAYSTGSPPFRSTVALAPAKSQVMIATVSAPKSEGAKYPLLLHLRGVYRVHLSIARDSHGADLLDSAMTYSQPFVVTR